MAVVDSIPLQHTGHKEEQVVGVSWGDHRVEVRPAQLER